MIDPTGLAFDIDGVIADTMHLFLDILADHYDVHTVRYEDITNYQLDQWLDLDEDTLEGAIARILEGRLSGRTEILSRVGQGAQAYCRNPRAGC